MADTLIAGNWKMNGLKSDLTELTTMATGLTERGGAHKALICLPATLVMAAVSACDGSPLLIGGETCHDAASGAHTGDISAEMLADAGASYVILGHSERRQDHAETDDMVAKQALAAMRASLIPIICVGESLDQREAGATLDVIHEQVARSIPADLQAPNFAIAYEPVWAIGTGKVANTDQIGEVHGAIRAQLAERFAGAGTDVSILYGGSMKPANAAEILSVPHVNGGLIGGASLKAADFLAIYDAAI